MSDPAARLLVLDDDRGVVDYLVEMLLQAGYDAAGFTSARAALDELAAGGVDLAIADVEMPEMRGTDFLAAALRQRPSQLVLLITAFGSIELGVQAVRMGACDFVAKPFKIEVLLVAVERALRERALRREIVRLRSSIADAPTAGLVAKSPAMRRCLDLARRAAGSDLTVLITGESGSGKGAVARFIHDHGPTPDGPFVAVNCAALPAQLIESELFGVHKGAYTDARETRTGLFAEAEGGTLLLDEVGEMPLEAQAKLLHVLETGRVRPIGRASELPVRVRVIAATNRPLEESLRARQFRPDLYYRLNVLRLEMPPLRERREDIGSLVDAFLERAASRSGRPVAGISTAAMRALLAHGWPGNVRELANAIERAVALAEHDTLVPEDIQLEVAEAALPDDPLAAAIQRGAPLEVVERAYIQKVLAASGGNKVRAARILGIDRRTLHRKIAGVDAAEPPDVG